jgi:ribokinase
VDFQVHFLFCNATTAAGNTFIGAFATRIACKESIEDAINFASRAAAITVSRMGAQQAIPTLDELMNQNH